MKRAHKIRLNPTSEQEQYLRQACGVARFAFNWGLSEWKKQYEGGAKPSTYALKKQFNAVRREEFPWSLGVSKCAVDTGFRNLDAAFKNFFGRCKNGVTKKGYPNFKSKRRSKPSFRMDGTRVKVEGHWLKLEKLNEYINMAEILRFAGTVRSVAISEDIGRWYAAINVEVEVEPLEHEHSHESVGIDLGVVTLAVLSDGAEFENPKLLRSELCKVKRFNRELSRRQQGSGRWQHTKRKLAKLSRQVANRRLDYQHKMTTEIASKYQIIGVEGLNVAEMLKNHHIALSVADAGFGEIKRQLVYKSEQFGGELVEIDRFFPSSKLCQFCGCLNDDMTLADRKWTCSCGAVLERDLNAAINIKMEALKTLRRSGFTEQVKNGRGEVVRPSGAILIETPKMAEERRPSELVI